MTDLRRNTGTERRSSVRVRSLLPLRIRPIDKEEIPAIEAKIIDVAVLESDNVLTDKADWSERTDELAKETVFLLNEIRALRQQISEMQRLVQAQGDLMIQPRWVVINDNGLFVPDNEDDVELEVGHFVEVQLQIPSLMTPDILAVGEIVRVGEGEDEVGAAVAFRYISEAHSKAIIRYALRRERQLARSLRFS